MGKYYDTFGGNKVSEYGLKHGYVDYRCFAKCFDAVLCNNICEFDESIWDNMENYYQENEDENVPEIFQWYIVSDNAKYFLDDAKEIYTYSEKLDCYIWCVTHYGTSWDYVLTEIKLDEVQQ